MKILEVTATCTSRSEATNLASAIIRARLAACANYWKISSVYWWNGKLQRSGEWMVVFKTALLNRKKIEQKLKKLHPYKLPAIIFEQKEVEKEFGKWVEGC